MQFHEMPHHEHPPVPHALPVRAANRAAFLFHSASAATLLALAFAGGLHGLGIAASVIIPSTVPLWTGLLTLGYMMQVEK